MVIDKDAFKLNDQHTTDDGLPPLTRIMNRANRDLSSRVAPEQALKKAALFWIAAGLMVLPSAFAGGNVYETTSGLMLLAAEGIFLLGGEKTTKYTVNPGMAMYVASMITQSIPHIGLNLPTAMFTTFVFLHTPFTLESYFKEAALAKFCQIREKRSHRMRDAALAVTRPTIDPLQQPAKKPLQAVKQWWDNGLDNRLLLEQQALWWLHNARRLSFDGNALFQLSWIAYTAATGHYWVTASLVLASIGNRIAACSNPRSAVPYPRRPTPMPRTAAPVSAVSP